MRPRVVAVWLALLSLLVVALPVHAQARASGPTILAQYFPAEVPFYIAAHTDAATLETFAPVYNRVAAQFLPSGAAPRTLDGLLNSLVATGAVPNDDDAVRAAATFDAIGAWLGGSVALTVSFSTNADTGLLAAEVRDYDAALAWLNTYSASAVADGRWIRAEVGGLVYLQQADVRFGTPEAALLTPDVLLYGAVDWVLQAIDGPPPNNLAATPGFGQALNDLPADDYSALLYIDVAALLADLSAGALQPAEGALFAELDAVAQALGATLMAGATRVSANAYALDVVTRVNPDAYAARGAQMLPACTDNDAPCAVQLDQLAVLQADTFAVAQVAGLRQVYDVLFANNSGALTDPAFAQLLGITRFVNMQPVEVTATLSNMLRARTGVSLADALAMLEGQLTLSAAAPSAPSDDVAPFDVLLRASGVRADAARRVVTALEARARLLARGGARLSVARVADGEDALTVRVTLSDLDRAFGAERPLVLELSAEGDVLLLGTRDAVGVARAEAGGYVSVLRRTLPEAAALPITATQAWVLTTAPLTTLADVLDEAGLGLSAGLLISDGLRVLAATFDAALVTVAQPDADLTVVRATLILAE